ncbi:FHA domain-containing protein FhaA [Botrimarina colliarenosi]|uniref:FHA domain-containing protein FhaA n=1 Tax=Botrimarina colliarenosi TaxID=2528001 RepID=A0A5C6A7T4_9BACT|nr:FHA domain-containing protein [Botrimarina colliarenosi]TWT96072.1 FHA domain-containing protein FhaA [Botrimarina colliarenosi]
MDAYHKLLGIPPNERPPNHYRLLAIELFETNREVISNAARGRCQFLRSVSLMSPEVSEPLLNEIMQAKCCLLDPVQRAQYDRELRAQMAAPESKLAVAERPGPAPAEAAPLGSRQAAPLSNGDDVASSFSSESWLLAPAKTDASLLTEWIVGSGSKAHIRVRAPWVSRRHCRLWREGGVAWIEDLGSTNGTFVNEVPLAEPTRLYDEDLVSLGRKTRLPWPLPRDCAGRDLEVYSIGRAPDCDYVLDDKSVSQHHAQLLIEGDTVLLQDLDSLNGTRVGSLANRITECELPGHVSVYFGGVKLFAQDLVRSVRQR